MIVHPRYPLRPGHLGELIILDLLARVPDEHGFAVHSVNLPAHEHKQWGVADFTVVSQPCGCLRSLLLSQPLILGDEAMF